MPLTTNGNSGFCSISPLLISARVLLSYSVLKNTNPKLICNTPASPSKKTGIRGTRDNWLDYTKNCLHKLLHSS